MRKGISLISAILLVVLLVGDAAAITATPSFTILNTTKETAQAATQTAAQAASQATTPLKTLQTIQAVQPVQAPPAQTSSATILSTASIAKPVLMILQKDTSQIQKDTQQIQKETQNAGNVINIQSSQIKRTVAQLTQKQDDSAKATNTLSVLQHASASMSARAAAAASDEASSSSQALTMAGVFWQGLSAFSTELHIDEKSVSGNTTAGDTFTVSVTATDSDDHVTRISLAKAPYTDYERYDCEVGLHSCTAEFDLSEPATGIYSYKIKARNERNQTVISSVTVTVTEDLTADTFNFRTAALDAEDFSRGVVDYIDFTSITVTGEDVAGLTRNGTPFVTFTLPSDWLLSVEYASEDYTTDTDHIYLDSRLPMCAGPECIFTAEFDDTEYTTHCSLVVYDAHYSCTLSNDADSNTVMFDYRAVGDPTGPNTVRYYKKLYPQSAPVVEFGTLSPTFVERDESLINLDDYVADADTDSSDLTWTVERNRNIRVDINPATHEATLTQADLSWVGNEIIKFVATDPDGNRGADLITVKVINNENNPPVITGKDPDSDTANVGRGSSRLFSIDARDPDFDRLSITWRKGPDVVATDTFSYTYEDSDGTPRPLTVIVSDGTEEAAEAWDIDIVEPIGTVEGAVTEYGTSNPIGGVTVQLFRPGTTTLVDDTETDASGHYSLTVHDGTYDLVFAKDGYEPDSVSGFVIPAGETVVQDMALEQIPAPIGTVAGTVTDASTSEDLAGVLVQAKIRDFVRNSTSTDSGGRYSMDLTEGTYTLTFSKLGYETREMAGVTITTGTTTTRNAELEETTETIGTISGTVTQEGTGAALSGVLVEVLEGVTLIDSDTTAADGTYSVDVEADTYDIMFSKEGYRTETLEDVTIPAGITTTADLEMLRWWNEEYGVKYPITIDADSRLSADTEFAIKLVFDASNIDYADFQSDGGDMRFVDGTDTAELPYFIEVWNTSGTSIVYVQTSISTTESRTIHLYGDSTLIKTSTGDFDGVFGTDVERFLSMNDRASDGGVRDLSGHGGSIGTNTLSAYSRDDADIVETRYGSEQFSRSTSQYILTDTRVPALTSGTISYWVDITADSGVFDFYYQPGTDGVTGSYEGKQSFSQWYYYCGSTVTSGFTLVPDQKYFITHSWDGTNHYLYVDGQLQELFPDTNSCFPAGASTTSLTLGGYCYAGTCAGSHSGSLDEFRVYSRNLEGDEILLLYDQPEYSVWPVVP